MYSARSSRRDAHVHPTQLFTMIETIYCVLEATILRH
uniref:Uncharacterized protein n=1 Tax=Picea sitchensis TaxID=3332 RepID=D5A913_PICSI|nr:unknown [Picea sitchensis]